MNSALIKNEFVGRSVRSARQLSRTGGMNSRLIKREFFGRSVLSANQFSRAGLEGLFDFAIRMRPVSKREVRTQVLGGHIMGSFFFEESTRTRISSETAFLRLGGSVVGFDDPQFSSMIKKKESFEDTVHVISHYCDMMTIRTTQKGQAAIAAKHSLKPVINAGDGSGEHPTQALLDCLTLWEAYGGKIGNIIVAVVGDLKYGRTVHSLVRMLPKLGNGVRFRFIAPDFLQMPEDVLADLRAAGVKFESGSDFYEGIRGVDAIYMVRPQNGRMVPAERKKWQRVKSRYRLTMDVLKKYCKKTVRILHPLPRNDEITTDVDEHKGALYLDEQIEAGVLIKMGLAAFILGKHKKFV